MKALPLIAIVLCASASGAPAQGTGQRQNPFLPPLARYQYAPDRQFDLQNLEVVLDVDYAAKTIKGKAVNTVVMLRGGIKELLLHAGTGLNITGVTVNGVNRAFRRDGRNLYIASGGLTKGAKAFIVVTYASQNAQGRGFGAGGGWHWIQPGTSNIKDRVGFWTQGETAYNSEWAPTWDYPNDLATSETKTTVPADWAVVGNGLLVGKTFSADKKKITYDWKMTQPHATYLLSLCGGPFDIKKDTWEGVELWYVVPKGSGWMIDDSFGDTKDMLSFFSSRIGVKYPWPKYAQNAMYDFGGGMENVSATTLGEGSLTEARDGFRRMAGLNSHELGHQWFGDLVTCYSWGDTWLNESFATFMEKIYMEHSRGPDAYAHEIADSTNGYLQEARSYKRPLSTRLYPSPDRMFDSHSYPKGGVVLHTLRRFLGDDNFYAGLKHYLNQWRYTPVESFQLRRAITEATGINVEAFWKQWIESPGHPVLDYTWVYEGGRLKLTVKQLQDTSEGTPIYDIQTKIGFVRDGGGSGSFLEEPVHLTKAEETFEILMPAKPLCVVLDPDHDFLREIPNLHWAKEELPFILRSGKNAPDRTEAMRRMLQDPTDAAVSLVVAALSADTDPEQPTFRQTFQLANLKKPELRGFWLAQLSHKNIDRQAQAASALAMLPSDAGTIQRFRALINDKSPIQVVVTCINALAEWDKKANADVFRKAQGLKDRRGRIKRAADAALAE